MLKSVKIFVFLQKIFRMTTELNDQEQFRREALNELRKLNIDPYPAAEFPVNATSV